MEKNKTPELEYKFYLINLLKHPLFFKQTMGAMTTENKKTPTNIIFYGLDEERIKNHEPQLAYLIVAPERTIYFYSPVFPTHFVFVDNQDPPLPCARLPFTDEEGRVFICLFMHVAEKSHSRGKNL